MLLLAQLREFISHLDGGGRYHHDGNGDHRNHNGYARYHHDGNGVHRNHNGYGGYHGDGHSDANVDNGEDRDDDY